MLCFCVLLDSLRDKPAGVGAIKQKPYEAEMEEASSNGSVGLGQHVLSVANQNWLQLGDYCPYSSMQMQNRTTKLVLHLPKTLRNLNINITTNIFKVHTPHTLPGSFEKVHHVSTGGALWCFDTPALHF